MNDPSSEFGDQQHGHSSKAKDRTGKSNGTGGGSQPDGSISLLDTLDPQADSFQAALVQSFTGFERKFREDHPIGFWVAMFAPFVLSFVALAAVGISGGWADVQKYSITALITFFALGRFVIPATPLIKSTAQDIPWIKDMAFTENLVVTPEQAFAMLTFMDVMVALFVTFNIGLMFRIPFFGPKIGMMVYDGQFILDRYPWLKRFSFLGLVLFVVFPASTTGSIGGAIFGRLLGLGRVTTLFGILLGSILGNGIMLFFADQIEPYKDSVILRITGIAIIISLVVLIEYRYRRLKQSFLEKMETKVE